MIDQTICDFNLPIRGEGFTLLQLTDTQIEDSSQMRTPDRLGSYCKALYAPENLDRLCLDHIRYLVEKTNPDLIFLTGDVVHGAYDDSGRIWLRFVAFMESLGIPWAPVFGNHDNELMLGSPWQCELLENAAHCLFKKGSVTGNGNYSIGLWSGDRLLRILYMLDSHGCQKAWLEADRLPAGLYADQLQFVTDTADRAGEARSLMAFHIPTEEFKRAEAAKGYPTESPYTIGVDTPPSNTDFGTKAEGFESGVADGLSSVLQHARTDGVFVGHTHMNSTSIVHDGVRFTFGTKTGFYDYYTPGQVGGTVVRLDAKSNTIAVHHEICPLAEVQP